MKGLYYQRGRRRGSDVKRFKVIVVMMTSREVKIPTIKDYDDQGPTRL